VVPLICQDLEIGYFQRLEVGVGDCDRINSDGRKMVSFANNGESELSTIAPESSQNIDSLEDFAKLVAKVKNVDQTSNENSNSTQGRIV